MNPLRPGSQIIYVPLHAAGDIDHPDAEPGFVFANQTTHGNLVACRFWDKRRPGELRTKANSESCNLERLHFVDTRPQEEVDAMVNRLKAGH